MGWGSQESRFLFVISTASERMEVGNLRRGGERRDAVLRRLTVLSSLYVQNKLQQSSGFCTMTGFGRELLRQEEELDVKEAALCSVSERTE